MGDGIAPLPHESPRAPGPRSTQASPAARQLSGPAAEHSARPPARERGRSLTPVAFATTHPARPSDGGMSTIGKLHAIAPGQPGHNSSHLAQRRRSNNNNTGSGSGMLRPPSACDPAAVVPSSDLLAPGPASPNFARCELARLPRDADGPSTADILAWLQEVERQSARPRNIALQPATSSLPDLARPWSSGLSVQQQAESEVFMIKLNDDKASSDQAFLEWLHTYDIRAPVPSAPAAGPVAPAGASTHEQLTLYGRFYARILQRLQSVGQQHQHQHRHQQQQQQQQDLLETLLTILDRRLRVLEGCHLTPPKKETRAKRMLRKSCESLRRLVENAPLAPRRADDALALHHSRLTAGDRQVLRNPEPDQ